ncbi:PHD finger protein 10 [Mortierella alpina]|nr:PHD finger protein 10 [Mortierella alpina]
MALPSPSRTRRPNARGSSVASVGTVKEATRKSRSAGKSSSNPEPADEEDDEDEEEGSDVVEELEATAKRSSRPTRSKKPSKNEPIRTTPGKPHLEDEDKDEDEDEEKDEEVQPSGDKSASEPKEEDEPAEDVEEIEGEIEEAGEAKITKDGELLGGREYKCRSFKMPTRGERVYMLSMDPARVLGFRDSYLFFLKNPQLVRVNTTVEERTWMIEKGMLMANFKSKLIAVVTARSIFKSFGHRIIKKGKNRIDDYYESLAAEDDPAEDSDDDGTSRTDDGRSQVNGNAEDKQGGYLGKRKHTLVQSDESTRQVTDLNWLYESALAVRALNAQLQVLRKENPKFMDPHTNIEQIAASTQPTHCNVTAVPTSTTQASLTQPTSGVISHVLSIPRSIGPQVDAVVKVEIKGAAPAPPVIQDPRIWAAIPEDIRKALEDADASKPKEEENIDLTKYPLSILDGHFQAAFPVHQARFQQPYRVVLPKSMAGHAQYIHHLHTVQSGGDTAPIMEQAMLPGQTSAQDIRMLQWQQQQQQQQQQAQQQQMLLQQAKLQQQQQEQQVAAAAAAAKRTESAVAVCGECSEATVPLRILPTEKPLPCATSYLNKCKTCSNGFHPMCLQLDTPRIISAIASYPWQCNDCKLCVVCLEAGDEASLLICDDCDRGWHMSCCDPAIKKVPQDEWLCSFCALCHSCRGSEDPTTEYKHASVAATGNNRFPTFLCTYCTRCHDNFKKGRYCPVCIRTYKGDGAEDDAQSDTAGEDDNNMVCCDECNRWVHIDCDGQLTEELVEEMGKDESLKYTCPPCALKVTPLRPGAGANVANVHQDVALQSLRGQAPVQDKVCGLLGGKTRVRGLVEYQRKLLGVPEIVGSGVEYDRKMVMELTALKNKHAAAAAAAIAVTALPAAKRKRGRPPTKSPAARRASIASSTSSSLSSVTGSVDS